MTASPLARQGARFVVVGLLATGVHVLVALAARKLGGASPLLANFAGYAASFGVSYLGNARWTFAARRTGAELARFAAASLAGLATNQALTWLIADALGLPFGFALGAVVIVVPVTTFLLSRCWVFR